MQMPYIPEIKIGNTTYKVKDQEAWNIHNQSSVFAGKVISGTISNNANTGKAEVNTSTTRIRTVAPIYIGTGVTVICKGVDGVHEVNWAEFDNETGLSGQLNLTWSDSEPFVTTKPYVSFLFRRKDNATYPVSEFDPSNFLFITSARQALERIELPFDENTANILDETNIFQVGYFTNESIYRYYGVKRGLSYGMFPVTAGETYRFEIDEDSKIGACNFVWYDSTGSVIKRDNHYPFDGGFEHTAPEGATGLVFGILLGKTVDGTTSEYGSPDSDFLRNHHAQIFNIANGEPDYRPYSGTAVDWVARDSFGTKISELTNAGNQSGIFEGNVVAGSYSNQPASTGKAEPSNSSNTNTTRIRMKRPVYIGTGVTVLCKAIDGVHQINWVEFDTETGFTGVLNPTWNDSATFVTSKPYVLFMFRRKDNEDFPLDEFDPANYLVITSERKEVDRIELPIESNTRNILNEQQIYQNAYYSGGTYTYFAVSRGFSYGIFPVTAGKTYRLSIDYDSNISACGFLWYNESGGFISRDNHYPFSGDFEHEAPEGATGLVFCILLGPLQGTYTEYGSPDAEFLRSHHAQIYDTSNGTPTYTPYKGTAIDWVARSGEMGTNIFKGKKMSVLGDSISTFTSADSEEAGHSGHLISDGTWTYQGNCCRYAMGGVTDVHNTYWMKVIDTLGMVLGINESWASSRVSWNGDESGDRGANKYIGSPTRIGHLGENGTPDYILVNAGTNDIGNEVPIGTFNTENPRDYTDEQIAALPVNTFADAYRTMLIRLQKSYPLAKIVALLPDYARSYYDPAEADAYIEIIKEACDYFGVPWIDMRAIGITMYNTGTYMEDGLHPNVAGMDLMAKKIIKVFQHSLT